ncbi:hypothetical protein NOVO_05615 [Rickettsiales bacterium Ac37b]|nr:hypothetical protein NOVO_05615 [Rickettsiales bacterium Ac37b]
MDLEKNAEIIFSIYKYKTKNLILEQPFNQLNNKFCFIVKDTSLYYWTAFSPLHSDFTINKLNFTTNNIPNK